jgi:4-amino-4-deoxy-L-arabinose transferase-like glycosyltransferase
MGRISGARWALPFFLIFHVSFWTAYGAFSNPGPLHGDMLEAYLWGHEFQLGYFKHPPFWAWIAGAWFEVFPRSNWAFYLLCSLNSGLALTGVWRLYGMYAPADARRAGLLLLFATPFYTFLSLNFNANTILLSIWPWTVFAFARSIERASLQYAVLFGVCAAAGLLSKYYSAVLLLSCAIASFVHPSVKRYYRSPAPYLAIAVAALLAAPHGVWLIENGFPTLEYAETRTAFSNEKTYLSIVTFVFGCLAFHAAAAGLVLLARLRAKAPSEPILDRSRLAFLRVLAFGPFAITILSGLVGHVRLSTNFATAIFILVPLMLMEAARPRISELNLAAGRFNAIILAAAIPIAAATPFVMFAQRRPLVAMPYLEAAEEAARQWNEATPAPLRTVAGTQPYSQIAAFYGKGEIKEFTNFNPSHAPWIDEARLAETGLLVICGEVETGCRSKAAAYATPASHESSVTLTRRFGGSEGPRAAVVIYVIPPWKGASIATEASPAPGWSTASVSGENPSKD